MTKIYSTLLLIVLVLYSCGAPKSIIVNDATTNGFSNDVKKVEIAYLENEKKGPQEEKIVEFNKEVIEYNKAGNKTSHMFYNEDGTPFLSSVYNYNEAGNLTDFNYQIPELYSDISISLSYDDAGRLNEAVSYDGGEYYYKLIVNYTDNGNVAELRYLEEDDVLEKRIVFEYSSNPKPRPYYLCYNVNTDEFYDGDLPQLYTKHSMKITQPIFDNQFFRTSDIVMSIAVQQINPVGNLLMKKTFNAEDVLTKAVYYDYDDKNRILAMHESNEKGEKQTKETFDYNDKSNITLKTYYYTTGQVSKRERLTYDRKDNLTLYQRLDINDEVRSSHIYKYNTKERKIDKDLMSRDGKMLYERSIFSFNERGDMNEYSYYVTFSEVIRLYYSQKLKFEYWN